MEIQTAVERRHFRVCAGLHEAVRIILALIVDLRPIRSAGPSLPMFQRRLCLGGPAVPLWQMFSCQRAGTAAGKLTIAAVLCMLQVANLRCWRPAPQRIYGAPGMLCAVAPASALGCT